MNLEKLQSDITDIKVLCEGIRAEQHSISKVTSSLSEDMWGKNGTPGVKIELDRIKQSQQTRNKWLTIIGGTVASVAVERVFSYFRGHP